MHACTHTAQVRRPLPLSVLATILLEAQILGVAMPQEGPIRHIMDEAQGWQVWGRVCCCRVCCCRVLLVCVWTRLLRPCKRGVPT
jgi:hypothetical protein